MIIVVDHNHASVSQAQLETFSSLRQVQHALSCIKQDIGTRKIMFCRPCLWALRESLTGNKAHTDRGAVQVGSHVIAGNDRCSG